MPSEGFVSGYASIFLSSDAPCCQFPSFRDHCPNSSTSGAVHSWRTASRASWGLPRSSLSSAYSQVMRRSPSSLIPDHATA